MVEGRLVRNVKNCLLLLIPARFRNLHTQVRPRIKLCFPSIDSVLFEIEVDFVLVDAASASLAPGAISEVLMLILCIQSRIIFRCIIHRIIRHLLMLNLEVSWRPLTLQLHFSICKCLLSAHVNALEPPTHKQPYHLLVVAANRSKSIQLFMHLADSFIFRPTVFDNFLRRNDQFIWLSVPLLVLSRLE